MLNHLPSSNILPAAYISLYWKDWHNKEKIYFSFVYVMHSANLKISLKPHFNLLRQNVIFLQFNFSLPKNLSFLRFCIYSSGKRSQYDWCCYVQLFVVAKEKRFLVWLYSHHIFRQNRSAGNPPSSIISPPFLHSCQFRPNPAQLSSAQPNLLTILAFEVMVMKKIHPPLKRDVIYSFSNERCTMQFCASIE